jgi:hypothetical protein
MGLMGASGPLGPQGTMQAALAGWNSERERNHSIRPGAGGWLTPSVRFFRHLSLLPWLQRIRCWAGKALRYARGPVIKLDLTGDGQLRRF